MQGHYTLEEIVSYYPSSNPEGCAMTELSKLRAWWFHRQGLDGWLDGASPAEVLRRAGWARSVGGSGPYLSLFSRAGLSREAVDEAVARAEIHELPSARGCTYVVPAEDYALALTLAREVSGCDMKLALKLGVTEKEVDKLCDAVLQSLAKGPLDPDEIRAATGKASRSLGDEGKKRGLTTTLPIAFERLQVSGEIRRIPTNGRLDQQRYRYALWLPNPLSKSKLSAEEAHTELARKYVRWIGPATLKEFQWFSGFGVKAAKAAVDSLKLVPIEKGSERLILAEDVDGFHSFKAAKEPTFALVSPLDSMVLLRRSLVELLSPEAANKKVYGEKGYCDLSGLADLPSNAILKNGEVVGLWEYDPVANSIAWMPFGRPYATMKKMVARTEEFVREQLGDARTFSLDSPKSRAPKIEALRKAAAG
jgi:hypothetical protein